MALSLNLACENNSQMKIFFLAPVFTRRATAEEQSTYESGLEANLRKWYRDEWLSITKEDPLVDCDMELLIGRTKDIETIRKHSGLDVRTDKGAWVAFCFQSILQHLHDKLYREPSAVVMLDGSGKIDFGVLKALCLRLQRGDQVLLGYRKEPLVTMAKERVTIEQFENYLLSQRFHVVLPDAQCGCWAFSTRLFCSIPFIARTYDIELDLLIGVLSAGIEPKFIEVELVRQVDATGQNQTSFTFDANIKKMYFLLHRLGLPPATIPALITTFETQFGMQLPDTYKNELYKIAGETSPYPMPTPRIYYKEEWRKEIN